MTFGLILLLLIETAATGMPTPPAALPGDGAGVLLPATDLLAITAPLPTMPTAPEPNPRHEVKLRAHLEDDKEETAERILKLKVSRTLEPQPAQRPTLPHCQSHGLIAGRLLVSVPFIYVFRTLLI